MLASGGEKLTQLNTAAFIEQLGQSGGFWMSYHELTNDYPWLCKRLARVAAAAGADATSHAAPRRHPMAWVFAALTPRFGLAGGGGSMIVMIAIPAYHDYTMRAQVMQAMVVTDQVQDAAQLYIEENRRYPDSLDEIGLPETFDEGPVSGIRLVEEGFELKLRSDRIQLDGRTIILGAMEYDDRTIGWDCTGGTVDPSTGRRIAGPRPRRGGGRD